MTARRFSIPLVAVVMICSLGPAAPPDGNEPAKDGKVVGRPVLVPVWKKTTIGLPKEEDLDWPQDRPAVDWLATRYKQTIAERRKAGRSLIPPAVPVPANGGILYVNDKSIASLSLGPDRTVDPPINPGDLIWAQIFSTWHWYREWKSSKTLDEWLTIYGDERADLIANHTLRSSIRLAERAVFFIDEMWVPVPAKRVDEVLSVLKLERPRDWFGLQLAAIVAGNEIASADSESGKQTARLGRDFNSAQKPTVFGGNNYLSAPFVAEGLTYLVHEKNQKVWLSALPWDKVVAGAKVPYAVEPDPLAVANKSTLWNTDVLATATPLLSDPHRRIHAIHLVKAGDLILCPTHLGRVVAVESKTGKIKWTHEYAPLDAKRFPTFTPEWVVVPPVVVGDKYVYAPADFPELLCLNVADGKKVWSVKKGDGLYPAVVGEQVLVIGEKTLRSLDLKDGSETWKLDLPGLPCGRGAVLGDHYLVPVSEPKTWRGMIAMVDVKNGKISEVIKPDKDEPVGNLVVHQDFLISQTLTEIAVFPIKKN